MSDPATRGGAATPAAPVAAGGPGAALVVDDDPMILAMLGDILRGANVNPLTAKSAEEAELLLAHRPFMAFLDVNLPGQQGDRFCQRLRMDEAWWDLPVVMITSETRSEVVRRCFIAGADDFALKPLHEESILAKVEAVRHGLGVAAPKRPAGKRVVLATEKEYFAAMMGRLLSAGGYEVLGHKTVEDAFAACEGTPAPDLVVVDLDLGGKGEGKLARRVRAVPTLAPLSLIAVAEDAARVVPDPSWAAVATYDVDEELERVVRHVNSALAGSAIRADRRGKPRVAFFAVVQFRLYGEKDWLASYGYDLSETGIFVRSLTPLASGKPVEIAFKIEDQGPLLIARGLVVWTNNFGPRTVFSYPYGMGISFSEFPIADWQNVHEYVQAHKGRG